MDWNLRVEGLDHVQLLVAVKEAGPRALPAEVAGPRALPAEAALAQAPLEAKCLAHALEVGLVAGAARDVGKARETLLIVVLPGRKIKIVVALCFGSTLRRAR